jgi:hypothetical protein
MSESTIHPLRYYAYPRLMTDPGELGGQITENVASTTAVKS